MNSNMILLILFSLGVVFAVGLYVYYRYKKSKFGAKIPDDIMKEFEKAEKIFKEEQLKGNNPEGLKILKRIYDERRLEIENNGKIDRRANPSNIIGEPKVIQTSNTGSSEVAREVQSGTLGLASNDTVPVADSKQTLGNNEQHTEGSASGHRTGEGQGAKGLFARLRR